MSRDADAVAGEDFIICPCFNVKRSQILKCLESGTARDLEEIRILSRAGAGCAGCEFEVEELIQEFYRDRGPGRLSPRQMIVRRLLIANKRVLERNLDLLRRMRCVIQPRPSFYGAWWAEREDFHTRINLCNIPSPSTPQKVWTERITVDIFSDAGNLLSSTDRTLQQSESLSLEIRELLPRPLQGHGLVRVKYHNRRGLGSKRFYSHYYSSRGLTFVHEKFSGHRKGPGGYWTLSGVPSSKVIDTFLIVSNGFAAPQQGFVKVTNAEGGIRRAPVEPIPPLGTRLVDLCSAIPDLNAFLAGRPGTAEISMRQGVMTCYVVHNREADTWQIQHL